jgi:hypothetical protein
VFEGRWRKRLVGSCCTHRYWESVLFLITRQRTLPPRYSRRARSSGCCGQRNPSARPVSAATFHATRRSSVQDDFVAIPLGISLRTTNRGWYRLHIKDIMMNLTKITLTDSPACSPRLCSLQHRMAHAVGGQHVAQPASIGNHPISCSSHMFSPCTKNT